MLEDEVEGEKKQQKKKKKSKTAVALMQEEERATKSVTWGVWIAYIKAGGGLWVGPLVLILLIMSQGANIATSLWLSWWTSNKFGYSEGTYVSLQDPTISMTQRMLTIVDRRVLSARRFSSSAHVRLLDRCIRLWYRSWQGHVAPRHHTCIASPNVLLRHHSRG